MADLLPYSFCITRGIGRFRPPHSRLGWLAPLQTPKGWRATRPEIRDKFPFSLRHGYRRRRHSPSPASTMPGRRLVQPVRSEHILPTPQQTSSTVSQTQQIHYCFSFFIYTPTILSFTNREILFVTFVRIYSIKILARNE